MSTTRAIKLLSNYEMPIVGLGTYLSQPGEVQSAVKHAIGVGYSHIDCAHVYGNESEVGEGIIASGKKREDLFIVSKLWNNSHKPERVLPCIQTTLKNLKLDYLDLYLVHWPIAFADSDNLFPKNEDGSDAFGDDLDFLDTWKAMEECVEKGLTRSIGLSNFNIQQIERVLNVAKVPPSVLQIENHVYLQQKELVDYCHSKNIAVTAYAPIGAPAKAKTDNIPSPLEDDVVKSIASKYNKTPAQVLLRFLIERNIIVIPKSSNTERIESNYDIFDFELTKTEKEQLTSLDKEIRIYSVPYWKKSRFYPF